MIFSFLFELLPLSNEFFLFINSIALLVCIYWVYFPLEEPIERKKRLRCFPSRARPRLLPPHFHGAAPRNDLHMDILSLARYVPKNVLLTSINEENTRNSIKRVIRHKVGGVSNTPSRNPPSAGMTSSATTPSTTTESTSSSNEVDTYSAICQKIMFPYMAGCEPDGQHAKELHNKYPLLSRPDIVRFLVARKGQIKAAEEMILKYLQWRASKFPLQKANVLNAFLTQCFFPYGRAKDGSPVVYMRGGLYDSNKATPEQYVLAAAYTIDWSLKQHPGKTSHCLRCKSSVINEWMLSMPY